MCDIKIKHKTTLERSKRFNKKFKIGDKIRVPQYGNKIYNHRCIICG